jgi:hypothetical protein
MNFIGFSIQQTSLYSYILSARTGLRILLPLLTGYESRGGGGVGSVPHFFRGQLAGRLLEEEEEEEAIYILRYITYLVLDSTALYVGDHFEEEIVQTSRESHHPVNIESSHLSLVLLPIGQSPAAWTLFILLLPS